MNLGWLITVVALVATVVLVVVPYLLTTAHRLDRLHVRTDAAWAGLDAALARRAAVARAATGGGVDAGPAEALRHTADRAEVAVRGQREAAENELTRRLADLERDRLPGPVVAELAEAEHRVVLARRVHNDAVRDTLALRGRRVVRWLKLAGTAALPTYFEIAEPAQGGRETAMAVHRRSARVLLVDGEGRLLLFRGHEPRHPAQPLWFTTGGGVEVGEQLRETAVREVREEAGIVLDPERLVGPVWRRQATFTWDGVLQRSDEWFFLVKLDVAAHADGAAVDGSGRTVAERSVLDGYRWWRLEELPAADEPVYPERLAELLPDLLTSGWDGQVHQVS